MTILPSNVSYGTVVGRYLIAYQDGIDADVYPDGIPCTGKIYFTPSVESLRNTTSSPTPVTIIPRPVVCELNADGYLTGPDGNAGVGLIATDDTDNDPVNWTWRVEYQLADQDGVLFRGISGHDISLNGGTTLDLITVAPVAGLVG
jgi:hypothetical protein